MTKAADLPHALELQASHWLNTSERITLSALRGKVVVIEAFQMLCPGCVAHGLPQAMAIAETFPAEQVAVLGLHCVFEHHDAMPPHSLKAFLEEYRIGFPVAIDQPGEGPIPRTMEAYRLRGTPSLLIIDRAGRLRLNHFGQASDMWIAAEISKLVFEEKSPAADDAARWPGGQGAVCGPGGCKS